MSDKKGWVRRASERIAAMDLGEVFRQQRNNLVDSEGGQAADTNRRAARAVQRHIGEIICEEMNTGDPAVISGDLPLEERNRVRARLGLPQLAEDEQRCAASVPSHLGEAIVAGASVEEQRAQVREDLCYGFAGAKAVEPRLTGTTAAMGEDEREILEMQLRDLARKGTTIIGLSEAKVEPVQRYCLFVGLYGDASMIPVERIDQAKAFLSAWSQWERAAMHAQYGGPNPGECPKHPEWFVHVGQAGLNERFTFAFPEIKGES